MKLFMKGVVKMIKEEGVILSYEKPKWIERKEYETEDFREPTNLQKNKSIKIKSI